MRNLMTSHQFRPVFRVRRFDCNSEELLHLRFSAFYCDDRNLWNQFKSLRNRFLWHCMPTVGHQGQLAWTRQLWRRVYHWCGRQYGYRFTRGLKHWMGHEPSVHLQRRSRCHRCENIPATCNTSNKHVPRPPVLCTFFFIDVCARALVCVCVCVRACSPHRFVWRWPPLGTTTTVNIASFCSLWMCP